jgi:hypothetical protein
MSGLLDRYAAEVARHMPPDDRAGTRSTVRAELGAATADLESAGANRELAERAAVEALGDPAALAAARGGYPRHLIGPTYFDQWAGLLRTLLAIVPAAVAGALLIAGGLAGNPAANVVGSAISVAFSVSVQLVFWVTVVFAITERLNRTPPAARRWTADDLPADPQTRITAGETAAGVVALALLIAVLLWQRDHWLITAADGQQVPALNPDLSTSWLPVLIAILVASAVLEVVNYRAGRWTIAAAVVNTVLNAAFALIVVLLADADLLLNPEVAGILPDGVPQLLGAVPWIVVVIATIDTVDGWYRAARARRAAR